MNYVKSAAFVRIVRHGEKIRDLIDEMKSLTWSEEAEFMVLKIASRERLMVKGGRDGIRFTVKESAEGPILEMKFQERRVRVVRIFGHTHPRATGPSQGDHDALNILGQRRSYIFEIGGECRGTLVRTKNP